jgi:hypothetical protein
MRVELIDNGSLTNLMKKINKFNRTNDRLLTTAVNQATLQSQQQFQKELGNGTGTSRPSIESDPKRGRKSTKGGFTKLIKWRKYKGYVQFQRVSLEAAAPYWLVQEIGTGKDAVMYSGDDGGTSINIPSQQGRVIPGSLVWADAQGQYDTPRPGVRNQQLMSYKDVIGAPYKQDLEPMRIGREIEGKHYIQRGGSVANAAYQTSLLSLAQDLFGKK